MIEAIGFDFDHTLGLDNKLERDVAVELGLKLAALEHTEFLDPDGSAFGDYIARYRNGETSLEAALITYFETFTQELDLGPAGYTEIVVEFKREALKRAPDYVRPLPGALSMLAALDAMGLGYAILTNGWSPLQEEKARLIGFRGPVIVSDFIGARKPAREAFQVLERHFSRPSENIAYVGDDPEVNVAGALRAGMIAVWFDWEGRVYPPELPPPTIRIVALSELPARLQGPVEKAANPAS